MGRSQETFNKKEVRNRKEKKRKDKVQKREKRKNEGKSSLDNMIAYVDEFGRISATPPDPNKKIEIAVEDVEYTHTKRKDQPVQISERKGVVTFFNDSKGYGFIRDIESNKSLFVHANNLEEPIKENNMVHFEVGKGTKGPVAMKVRLIRD